MAERELEALTDKEICQQQEDEVAGIIKFNAYSMQEGWYWEEWNRVGALYSPDGEEYFEYDLNSFNGHAVEYRETRTSSWQIFDGSEYEFHKFAEKIVREKLAAASRSGI